MKRVIFTLILALASVIITFDPPANAATGAMIQQNFSENVGRPLAGVTALICTHVVNPPNPCVTPATIYKDPELTIPITNPTLSDAYGNLLVYVNPGAYDLTVSGNDLPTMTYTVTAGSGSGVGSVTSVGLLGPTGIIISGSPITTIGTLTFSMPTGWGTGSLLLGNGANSVTNLPIGANTYTLTSNGVTAAWTPPSASGLQLVTCMIIIGDDSSAAPLLTGNIQPQRSQCYQNASATVVSVILLVNAGASTAQLGYRHNGSTTALSSTLTPGTVAGITDHVACADVGGTAITIEGNSVTCSALSNTTLTQGDYIETIGGAADGTTVRVSIAVTFSEPGGGGGGSGTPGGTNGQTQYNNGGVFGGFTMAGDCTLTVPNIACTKTGGVAFSPSATTDTTNASNISSGTLNAARLPSLAGLALTNLFGIAGFITVTNPTTTPQLVLAASITPQFIFTGINWPRFNGGFGCATGSAPSVASGFDLFYCDSSTGNLLLSNNGSAFAAVRTGTVSVINGGTSLTNITLGNLLCGNGTGTPTFVVPVSSGDVLTDNGAGACPTYQPPQLSNILAGASVGDYPCVTSTGPVVVSDCTPGLPSDTQSANTPYAIPAADRGSFIIRINSAAVSDTIAQAGTGGFTNKWYVNYLCTGTFYCTITPTTSTIDCGLGATTSCTMLPGNYGVIKSDDSNYRLTITRTSTPEPFANVPACAAAFEGISAAVTDSSTVTWGATVTGSSTSHVKAYCDATNWTVEAK